MISFLAIAILSVSSSLATDGLSEVCEFVSPTNQEFCYWTEVHQTWDTTYALAQEICELKGSSLAVIRDEATYQAIMENLREKIPDYWNTLYAWIGNTFNPETRTVLPSNSYIKWYPINEPRTESESYDNFFLHLYVQRDPESELQGMGNVYPEFLWPAVVCEYKL
ncbi:uncharacterized protein LOC120332816 [Styela clava]